MLSQMTLHPLDPLRAGELRDAVTVLRTDGHLGRRRRLVSVSLEEPAKGIVRGHSPGDPVDRRAFAVVHDPDDGQTFEAVVSLGERSVRSWRAGVGRKCPSREDEVIVECAGCKTRFRLADEKVRDAGTRVRCSRCGSTFVVKPPAPPPAPRPPGGFTDVTFGPGPQAAAPATGFPGGFLSNARV